MCLMINEIWQKIINLSISTKKSHIIMSQTWIFIKTRSIEKIYGKTHIISTKSTCAY